MSRTTIIVAAAAFIVAATVTGIARGGVADPATAVSTTSSTSPPLAEWVAPAEIVVPPVVIVPTRIRTEAGVVEIEYDLVGLAFGDTVRPIAWTLIAGDASFPATAEPTASRVSFDVGFDFDPTSITGLRLDRYVLRSPIQTAFTPALDDFTTHQIAPGVTAALDIVQAQSTGALVRVQVSSTILGATSDLAAEGVGPGWVTASSNFGGGGLWTLSYEGESLPDPLPLVVRGILWVPVDTDLVSNLERIPRD